MIKIGINGACGKMGLRLVGLIHKEHNLKLTVALERLNHSFLGKDIGEIAGLNTRTGILVTDKINGKQCDVIIDFSLPEGTMKCLEFCKKHKIALIIGTTGFKKSQTNLIIKSSKKIPILISPNFSQGSNLLGYLGKEAIKALGKNTDIEIVETHHKAKKDAPSGTAIRLSNELQIALGKRNIQIHSMRLGDVVGDHSIILAIPGERIVLTHQVDNRDAFAYGALKAARKLANKKPGFYNITDILC
jgi:4-hydroxy-tetrahydrodipicolinate reductase